MLHIRGSGDDVLTPVFRLAGALFAWPSNSVTRRS